MVEIIINDVELLMALIETASAVMGYILFL